MDFYIIWFRIIVGTLLEVGQGKREPKRLKKYRCRTDRKSAGKTAPGHGLYFGKYIM